MTPERGIDEESTKITAQPGLKPNLPGEKRSNFRWTLALFATLMTFMSYIDRVNLSVATPSIMRELQFTKVQIGMLQTVFFFCYALFQVPSGTLVEYFGHRKIVPLSLAWWSVFTSLTATCRAFSTWLVVRGLFGIGEAPIYPGVNNAFSYWFPRKERGKAVGFLVLGARLGTIFGIPLAALVMAAWGWRSMFVIFGAIGLGASLAYYLLLRTHPRESRFVNGAELQYIADGQQIAATQERGLAPWGDFLHSAQFWAIGVQFAMVDYISYVFIAWLPVFLMEAHHFSLKQMGFAAAIPELGFAVGTMFCGIACDSLIGKKKITASKSRAWFAAVGFVLCGIGLYMTAIADTKWTTIAWLTFALTFLGFPTNSSWATCTDIGGRFSGTVSGWMNFIGNMIGAAAPMLTAWIATRYGWRLAILATASTGIVGTILWIFVRPDVPLKHCYSGQVKAQS